MNHQEEYQPRKQSWRVGKSIPINVYDGDRPVCQCHTVADAHRIVKAVNAVNAVNADTELLRQELRAKENALIEMENLLVGVRNSAICDDGSCPICLADPHSPGCIIELVTNFVRRLDGEAKERL